MPPLPCRKLSLRLYESMGDDSFENTERCWLRWQKSEKSSIFNCSKNLDGYNIDVGSVCLAFL